ncbi:hypothetical protein JRQ81_009280 [Phrynocephalus forsythii]|uniref:Uncharacterized protein n=1 Tax=Phrynocephalus forsythii TaxID=171643 RepID=A0A9Q0XCW2_9SAUR|nr:hypothetical protein JRQ81_009280 [Phrynocephalus forsythii]
MIVRQKVALYEAELQKRYSQLEKKDRVVDLAVVVVAAAAEAIRAVEEEVVVVANRSKAKEGHPAAAVEEVNSLKDPAAVVEVVAAEVEALNRRSSSYPVAVVEVEAEVDSAAVEEDQVVDLAKLLYPLEEAAVDSHLAAVAVEGPEVE